MLSLYVDRAQLSSTAPQRVLDVGCGWGSFTLFAAEKFPQSTFVAVSNSASQREYIVAQAAARRLSNVTVVTADINNVTLADLTSADKLFDRIISIECFEHVKNYRRLFERVASLMTVKGRLFIHIFTHRHTPYHFESDSWMSNYFFTGGTMPSADLFHYVLPPNLTLTDQWAVNGRHYARTSRQWLEQLDSKWTSIAQIMRGRYDEEAIGIMRMWRAFFIAVELLFDYNDGNEWFVSHYSFSKH